MIKITTEELAETLGVSVKTTLVEANRLGLSPEELSAVVKEAIQETK